MNLSISLSISEDEVAGLVANLTEALGQLGREFVLFRLYNRKPVPEDERRAAVEGLRKMGLSLEILNDGPAAKLQGCQATVNNPWSTFGR